MKKTLTVLLTAVIILFAFAGCTANGESSSDGSNSSSNSSTSFDLKSYLDKPYLSWNSEDWGFASDAEKVDCCLTYAAYKISVEDGTDEDYANQNMVDIIDEDLAVVTEIFNTMDDKGYATLKDAVDAGYEPTVESSAS